MKIEMRNPNTNNFKCIECIEIIKNYMIAVTTKDSMYVDMSTPHI